MKPGVTVFPCKSNRLADECWLICESEPMARIFPSLMAIAVARGLTSSKVMRLALVKITSAGDICFVLH